MENELSNFTITVEVLGEGIKTELDVIPGETTYLILLDGVEFTTISYEFDKFPNWRQVDGNLDQESVSTIGEAIESHLT